MEIQPGISIYLGDCLEVMNGIPAGSVDMVMADLPYGTTACEWDSVIPLEPLWVHYKRVIKPRGAIVLTASQPFTTTLIASNMAWFKYCWVWEKGAPSNPQLAKMMPLKVHEDIAVFYANRPAYNPQGIIPFLGVSRQGKRSELGHCRRADKYRQEFTHYPKTIQHFMVERGEHPTQKPVALMEYLISTYTNEGELVLDNTMGSGTTGVACIRTGRRFIGIEKDPDIFETARQRLSGGKPQVAVIGNTVMEQARLF